MKNVSFAVAGLVIVILGLAVIGSGSAGKPAGTASDKLIILAEACVSSNRCPGSLWPSGTRLSAVISPTRKW